MSILPWGKKKTDEDIATEIDLRKSEEEKGALVVSEEAPPKTALAPVKQNNDIVIRKNRGGAIIQVRSKEVAIAGTKRKVDPYQLIRMIKRVTQNIGEYKTAEDIYSAIIMGALRKARGDLVSILENEFGIHWQINEDGESTFYM